MIHLQQRMHVYSVLHIYNTERMSILYYTFTTQNACLFCTTHLQQRMHVRSVLHIYSRECMNVCSVLHIYNRECLSILYYPSTFSRESMFILYYTFTAQNACIFCTTHLQQRMHVYSVLHIYSRECMFILYYTFTAQNACLLCTKFFLGLEIDLTAHQHCKQLCIRFSQAICDTSGEKQTASKQLTGERKKGEKKENFMLIHSEKTKSARPKYKTLALSPLHCLQYTQFGHGEQPIKTANHWVLTTLHSPTHPPPPSLISLWSFLPTHPPPLMYHNELYVFIFCFCFNFIFLIKKAISTFSPVGLLSSTGLRMRVCVCLCTALA